MVIFLTGPNSEMSAQGALAAPGEGLSASGGKFRHGAANCGTGFSSEPERARLKLMHQGVHKPLSAHLFFGVSCRKMWRPVFMGFAEFIEVFWRLWAETRHGR